jgi:hypothetical protein
MAIRSSRYFNDPNFAQAASNLASMFAPPSGAEAAAWAEAQLRKQKAEQLADLFGNPNQPDFDRRNIAVGNYAPTQSFYAQNQNNSTARYRVDQDNATSRYRVDQDSATSRANNAEDNSRAIVEAAFRPLSEGRVRPAIPAEVAGKFGISALPQVAGTPKPLSETEWQAAQNERLRQAGQLPDSVLIDAIVGDKTPVQALGPSGAPVYMSPGAAVRQGAQPYEKPTTSNLDGDNYLGVGPDGQEARFVGRPNASGGIVDINTGKPFPGQILRKEGTSGGMSVEVGKDGTFRMVTGNGAGQTNSRVTDLQRQEAEAGRAASELTSLFNVLRQDDVGVAGNVNEIATNYGAQFFPGLARPDVAGTRSQLNASTLSLAKALLGDDRLSDADRRAAKEVMVSGGLGESLPGARAKLATLITLSAYRQKFANTVRAGGAQMPPLDRRVLGQLVDDGAISPEVASVYAGNVLGRGPQATNSPVPGVNIPTAVPPLAGTSGAPADIPIVRTPEEAAALPSGTRFRTPDGREKVRP